MRECAAVGFVLVLALWAGAARLVTDIDRDTLHAGDRFTFSVGVVVPGGTQVEPPDPQSAFAPLEMRDWSSSRESVASGDSIVFKYILSLWSAEPCSIPPLRFIAGDTDPDTIITAPIALTVRSVLSGDTVQLRQLKPQQQAGKPSRWWLWTILVVSLLSAAVLAVVWLMRKLRTPPVAPPPPPPYEEALEALRVLDARGLVQQGLLREYVFALSDIVKRYAGRRFECNAAEWTTQEMLDWLRKAALAKESTHPLENFLRKSDPVKFARLVPDTAAAEQFRLDVWQFIDRTRPSLESAAGPTTAALSKEQGGAGGVS